MDEEKIIRKCKIDAIIFIIFALYLVFASRFTIKIYLLLLIISICFYVGTVNVKPYGYIFGIILALCVFIIAIWLFIASLGFGVIHSAVLIIASIIVLSHALKLKGILL